MWDGVRSGLYGGCSNGIPPISVSTSIATFQLHNANTPLRLHHHPKKYSFKMTVTLFSRSRWSVISASLAKGGTSKKKATVTIPPQSESTNFANNPCTQAIYSHV